MLPAVRRTDGHPGIEEDFSEEGAGASVLAGATGSAPAGRQQKELDSTCDSRRPLAGRVFVECRRANTGHGRGSWPAGPSASDRVVPAAGVRTGCRVKREGWRLRSKGSDPGQDPPTHAAAECGTGKRAAG